MSSCAKEKETLRETSQEADIKNRNLKSKFCDSVIGKKEHLKLFTYNIEHKPKYIYLLLHFLF